MGSNRRGFSFGGLELGLVTAPFHAPTALGVLKIGQCADFQVGGHPVSEGRSLFKD
jgi:hypothetical protein